MKTLFSRRLAKFWKWPRSVLCIWLVLIFFMLMSLQNESFDTLDRSFKSTDVKFDYLHDFKKYARDNLLILTTTDYFYLGLALNLHKSMEKFNVRNYVFVCTHVKAYEELQRRNIQSILFGNDDKGEVYTVARSKSYNVKTLYKTEVVLAALQSNLSVFFVDIDSVLLQDPTPYLKQYNGYDLVTTQENDTTLKHDHNSGLYLAHPTKHTKELHRKIIQHQQSTGVSNQIAMNLIMKTEMKRKLKVTELDPNRFYGGIRYHGGVCCWFADDACCPRENVVILHNNGINTLWGKIYRFKEHLMWYLDNDGYYSSTKRKYLQMTFQSNSLSKSEQQRALQNGFQVAALLNRTLILPKFMFKSTLCSVLEYLPFYTCDSSHCNLLGLSCVRYFDEKFGDRYREHMFLHNPLVPQEVRNSVTEELDVPSKRPPRDSIQKLRKEYKTYSVLRLKVPHEMKLDYNESLTRTLRAVFDDSVCWMPWWRNIVNPGWYRDRIATLFGI